MKEKKTMKRFAAIMLALAMCLSISVTALAAPPATLSAVEENERLDPKYPKYFEAYKKGYDFNTNQATPEAWQEINVSYYTVKNTGQVAYCTQRPLDAPKDTEMTLADIAGAIGQSTLDGMISILQNGYPMIKAKDLTDSYPGITDDEIQYATAMALQAWMLANGKAGYENSPAGSEGTYITEAEHYLNYKKNPAKLAPSGYNYPTAMQEDRKHLELGTSKFSVKLKDGVNMTDLTSNERAFMYFAALLNKAANKEVRESSINGLPASANILFNPATNKYEAKFSFKLVNCSGSYDIKGLPQGSTQEEVLLGNEHTITVSMDSPPREPITLTIEGKDSRSSAQLQFYVAQTQQDTHQIMAVPLSTSTVVSVSAQIQLKAPRELVITKTDLTSSTPVKGATIEIYDSQGTMVYRDITDDNGQISTMSLTPGKYTFKETIAPRGYKLNTGSFEFTINDDGTVSGTTSFTNELAKYPVKITKTDLTNEKPVPGAKVAIYDKAGNLVHESITGADGKTKEVYLAPGEYVFKETLPPVGYKLNTNSFNFSISEDGTISGTTSFKDEPNDFRVTITKTDLTTVAPVPGAKVAIYDSAGNKVYEDVTDANGRMTSTALKPGQYTFKETLPPAGYKLNTNSFTFTIGQDGKVTGTTSFTDERMDFRVTITKTDLTTAAPVPGAKVAIYDSTGKKVYEDVTDANGRMTSTTLSPGQYTFRETLPPAGYKLNTNSFTFNIGQDGKVTGSTNFTNERTGGGNSIRKTDLTTAAPVPGATIEIYDISGKRVYQAVTDSNGQTPAFSLTPGKYTFKETLAPSGYALNSNTFTFVINNDGTCTGNTTFTDEYIKVPVKKVDAKNISKELSGATFVLYRSSDNSVVKALTTGAAPTYVLDSGRVYHNPSCAQIKNLTGLATVAKNELNKYTPCKHCTPTYDTTTSGTVTFTGMPVGKYYIKETSAPKGYTLANEVIQLDITQTYVNPTAAYVIKDSPTVQTGAEDMGVVTALFVLSMGTLIFVTYRKMRGTQQT